MEDALDNCPGDANASQSDVDADGAGDLCDPCPAAADDVCEPGGSTAEEVPADEGGTVQTGDGAVTIDVDPGDLAEDQTLSVTETVVHDPEVDVMIGATSGLGQAVAVYDLEPEGVSFSSPVTLTITGDVSGLGVGSRNKVDIYRHEDTNGDGVDDTFVALGATCVVDEATLIVTCTVEVDHFSLHALIAPLDTDGDGVPDLFPPEEDACPTTTTRPTALGYSGDMLVAIGPGGSATANLVAELVDAEGLGIEGAPLDFSLHASSGADAGTCVAETDASGAASCSIADLLPEVYEGTLAYQGVPGCLAAVEDRVLLVVFDPNLPRATGGGFILPDSESTLPAQSENDKANFGFIVRIDKKRAAAGNLEFQYKAADLNLKSQGMSWYTVSNTRALFQGQGSINGEGLFTFRVDAVDGDLSGGQPDRFDIKIWEGMDTEADPLHRAKNDLAGGSIVIHRK